MQILLKLLKYAISCFIAFFALVFIVGPISEIKTKPAFMIFPALLLCSGYYTYNSAKSKGLAGSQVLWGLYGIFVPVVSWIDISKVGTSDKNLSQFKKYIKQYRIKWEMWEMEHEKPEQRKRWMKSVKDCSLVKILDAQQGVALIKGEKGGEYTTSLTMCSCSDFTKRHKPCKHMYFLAYYLNVFNPFDI